MVLIHSSRLSQDEADTAVVFPAGGCYGLECFLVGKFGLPVGLVRFCGI